MHLKTIQASAFKAIFEVLKDIINDVNVYFSKEGVRILTIDTAHVTLVHMNLAAENFEEYDCDMDIIAGLNIHGRDVMEIQIENSTKKSATNFKLKLLDINEDILEVPDIPMNVVTTMPSIDFQKIARDMGNLSNEMSIIREGNILELSCKGDFADQLTRIEYPETVPRTGNVFSLKYINMYTKATGMCSSVQILQDSSSEDMPVIFRYTIANLGDLKFYLAPKLDDK